MDTLITTPFWPREDVWPPGTLRKSAAMAYRALHDQGIIELQKVIYSRQTDITRFRYLAMSWGPDITQALETAEDMALLRLEADYYATHKEG
ncbi:MAG: hypothetical protein VB087_07860 [Candidatus Limiplasma sp.]|nr:hypothetical protein [Candidatus Limiplasma sp.]MEA5145267.1 hypothetical protein [Candidatus Limiplasma sp.]